MEDFCVYVLGYEKTWTLSGLGLDFLGVVLLGIDLIKVQISQRLLAQMNLSEFQKLASEYGGIADWAEDLRKGSRWVPSDVIERHHILSDEVTFNIRAAIDDIKSLAGGINELGKQIANLVEIMGSNSQNEVKSAERSAILSSFGLILIAIGFSLQIVGVLPCL